MKRRQGDFEEAKLAYERALDLNPDDGNTYATYSFFLNHYLGDAAEGARMMRKAYDVDPMSRRAPRHLAEYFEWSGQLDKAQALRESTAVKDPEDAKVHEGLGSFYIRYVGHFDDAIVACRKALFLDPKNQIPVLIITDAYAYLGDKEQAVFWAKRVVEMTQDPKGYWMARIFELNGDDAARERIALEGLEKNPRHGVSLLQLTDINIASGHPEKSRSRWELAYPSLFEPSVKIIGRWIPDFEVNDVWKAKALARVLMATGEREQANYLIAEALATARSMDKRLNHLLLEASLHAIAGDERQSLAAIRRFFEAGGSPYNLMFQDELKPFQDNPEYQEMAVEAEARMAAQLKRLREMEANGELAPIPELPAD
jgi:tetratricopeptide (TPR) repeat protein